MKSEVFMCADVAESKKTSTLVASVEEPSPLKTHVNLSPVARRMLDELKTDTGVPLTVALERFIEWLARQDPRFRLAVLNKDASTQQILMRDIAAKMTMGDFVSATNATAEMTPEQ